MLITGTKGRSDVNQGNEGDGLKIFLHVHRDGRHSLDLPRAAKNTAGCKSVWNSQAKATHPTDITLKQYYAFFVPNFNLPNSIFLQ